MFGQQFPNPVASAAKWVFLGSFGVVLMGFLLGANFKDATWLNRDIAAAEADRINIENAHQQAINELQERHEAAKTDAEIQQIKREQELLDAQYQHDIQVLSQDLAHRDAAFKTRMTVLTFLGSALSIALVLGTFFWTGSKVLASISFDPTPTPKYIPPVKKKIVNLPERKTYDRWTDLNYRSQKRTAAQNQERKDRETRLKSVSDPAKMSGDKRNKLPLAGD